MVYPDGETLTYSYDVGGNLNRVENLNGYAYIADVGYDEYEQKVFCAYGNGTTNTWAYTPELRRLDHMTANTATGNKMFDNAYTYDRIDQHLTDSKLDISEVPNGTYFIRLMDHQGRSILKPIIKL